MAGFGVFERVLRLFFGGFFIWSGGMKLPDLAAFSESVGNFQFAMEVRLPGNLEAVFEAPTDAYLAYSLPWFEIIGGVAVVSGLGVGAGLVILGGLLASFNLALWSAWDRGITDLQCGCHGVSENATDYGLKMGSNFLLLLVVGVILVLRCLLGRREGDGPVS